MNDDKRIIAKLRAQEEAVVRILELASPLDIEWRLDENKKASRLVVAYFIKDIINKDDWEEGCKWLCDMCVKIKRMVITLLK